MKLKTPPAEAWWCPIYRGAWRSYEVEAPPAEAWWCLIYRGAWRSYEVEAPPAEAWWCLICRGAWCGYEVETPPAEAWWSRHQLSISRRLDRYQTCHWIERNLEWLQCASS